MGAEYLKKGVFFDFLSGGYKGERARKSQLQEIIRRWPRPWLPRFLTLTRNFAPAKCDPQPVRARVLSIAGFADRQVDDDETQPADGQTSNSEGERGSASEKEDSEIEDSEETEPADAKAVSAKKPSKKSGGAKRSPIAKKAVKAKESPTRTRVAGKRRIVAVDAYNPEKLEEQNAAAKELAKKAAKKAKRSPTKAKNAQTKVAPKRASKA